MEGVDSVVHAAVARDANRTSAVAEVQMAAAVCAAADATGVGDVVTFGSSTEYGHSRALLHEQAALTPTTAHGVAKAAGTTVFRDWAAAAPDATVTVLRPFHVTGPGEPTDKLLPRALAAAHGGPPLPVVAGGATRDVVGVDDVVEGVLAALAAPPEDGVPVNLSRGVATGVEEFVRVVERVTGREVPTAGVHPRSEFDDDHRVGDPTRAAQLWGWRARPLEDVIGVAVAAWPWGRP